MMKHIFLATLFSSAAVFAVTSSLAQNGAKNTALTTSGVTASSFRPGELWYDQNGDLFNAHGGGILQQGKTFYWYGEKRGKSASEGVNVYSSTDLYNWKPEGLALAPATDTTSDIRVGCVMERPKV